jgi:hypothetical protein
VATPDGLAATLDEFEREIGLANLVAVHANDSKCPLRGGVDRTRTSARATRSEGCDPGPPASRRTLCQCPVSLGTRSRRAGQGERRLPEGDWWRRPAARTRYTGHVTRHRPVRVSVPSRPYAGTNTKWPSARGTPDPALSPRRARWRLSGG